MRAHPRKRICYIVRGVPRRLFFTLLHRCQAEGLVPLPLLPGVTAQWRPLSAGPHDTLQYQPSQVPVYSCAGFWRTRTCSACFPGGSLRGSSWVYGFCNTSTSRKDGNTHTSRSGGSSSVRWESAGGLHDTKTTLRNFLFCSWVLGGPRDTQGGERPKHL